MFRVACGLVSSLGHQSKQVYNHANRNSYEEHFLCVGGKTNAKKSRELSWWSQPLGKKLIFDLLFLSDRSDVFEFRVSTFCSFLLFLLFFHTFWFRHRARELESPSRIDFLNRSRIRHSIVMVRPRGSSALGVDIRGDTSAPAMSTMNEVSPIEPTSRI